MQGINRNVYTKRSANLSALYYHAPNSAELICRSDRSVDFVCVVLDVTGTPGVFRSLLLLYWDLEKQAEGDGCCTLFSWFLREIPWELPWDPHGCIVRSHRMPRVAR